MTDIEAITQLVARERQTWLRHLDAQNLATYWPDATVVTSWQSGPIAAFAGKQLLDCDPSLPLVSRMGTPLVHQGPNANRAYVELPSTTKRWLQLGGVQAVLESWLCLVYRVEQRAGEWRISNLSAISEADTLGPAVPGTDLNIDVRKAMALRPSYRFLAYTQLAAGNTIDQNGIGTDRPETVQPIYDAAEAWIK